MGSDRRPREACAGQGSPAAALLLLTHGSVILRSGGRRGGSLGLQTPWSPRRKVLLETRASFWFILAVWAQSSHEHRRHSQEGKERPGVPSVGSWVRHQISLGQSEAPPKGPGASWCEPSLRQLLRQASRHHSSGSQRLGRLPMAHRQDPPHLSNVARRCQEPALPQKICKQGQKDVFLKKT